MDSSIDQQFIEFVVKSLVNNPDDIEIKRTIDEKGVLLELTVNPEDLGRVIGKRGATAQSLRTLLRALGTKNDARYNLKIVDNGEPRPQREYQDNAPANDGRQPQAVVQTDDHNEDNAPKEETVEEPEMAEKSVADTSQEETDHSDAVRKTRAELADLDDLDI